jgi:hypothetical protein
VVNATRNSCSEMLRCSWSGCAFFREAREYFVHGRGTLFVGPQPHEGSSVFVSRVWFKRFKWLRLARTFSYPRLSCLKVGPRPHLRLLRRSLCAVTARRYERSYDACFGDVRKAQWMCESRQSFGLVRCLWVLVGIGLVPVFQSGCLAVGRRTEGGLRTGRMHRVGCFLGGTRSRYLR